MLHGDKARRGRVAHEAQRLARDTHAALHLGTDGHEIEVGSKHVDHPRVELVSAIEPHRIAQQARAYPDADAPAWQMRRIGQIRGGGGRLAASLRGGLETGLTVRVVDASGVTVVTTV